MESTASSASNPLQEEGQTTKMRSRPAKYAQSATLIKSQPMKPARASKPQPRKCLSSKIPTEEDLWALRDLALSINQAQSASPIIAVAYDTTSLPSTSFTLQKPQVLSTDEDQPQRQPQRFLLNTALQPQINHVKLSDRWLGDDWLTEISKVDLFQDIRGQTTSSKDGATAKRNTESGTRKYGFNYPKSYPFAAVLESVMVKFNNLRIAGPLHLPPQSTCFKLRISQSLPTIQPSFWEPAPGDPSSRSTALEKLSKRSGAVSGRLDAVPRSRRTMRSTVAFTANMMPTSIFTDAKGHPMKCFTLFPWLPPELRLKIWAMNLPGPRYFQVIEKSTNQFSCSPIVNLSVCRESRKEALKVYTFSFAVGDTPPLIPFNFEMDTLFISPEIIGRAEYFRNNCSRGDLARVKRLAVQDVNGVETWRRPSYAVPRPPREFLFSGLEEFIDVEPLNDYMGCVNCRQGDKQCITFPSCCSVIVPLVHKENEALRQILMVGPLFAGGRLFHLPSKKCKARKYCPVFPKDDKAVKSWKVPKVTKLASSDRTHLQGAYMKDYWVRKSMRILKFAVFKTTAGEE